MTRTPVESSNVKAIGYDPNTRKLEIEFNSGEVHEYSDVAPGMHKALMGARSIGGYFHQHIRNRHKSRPVA